MDDYSSKTISAKKRDSFVFVLVIRMFVMSVAFSRPLLESLDRSSLCLLASSSTQGTSLSCECQKRE